jgi:hypothetical protein
LKIYIETPDGRLNRDLRATLPINQLKGKPPQGTVAVCPILHHFALEMRNVTLPFHSNLPIKWATVPYKWEKV